MPLKKRKTIGQVDPWAKKKKQQRRGLEMLCQRASPSRASETEQQLPLQVGPSPDTDSVGRASVALPLPHPLTEPRQGRERGAEVGWDGATARDARGRPQRPPWECENGMGLYSFLDSFNQSLQVLGSHTDDDATGAGAAVDSDATPPEAFSASLPALPLSVADPAGLRELQKAMGATDEEMAILQQLGGEGPIWIPVKVEVSPSDLLSEPKEEEEEEEVDIVDLDCQQTAPVVWPGEGSEGAAATGRTDKAPTGDERTVTAASATVAIPVSPAVSAERQRRTRAANAESRGAQKLLAAYEAKEMVCPWCHRFFLGASALQQHMRVAHDGHVGLDSLKRKKNHCSTVSGPSEFVAASVLGTSADSPPKLACPHCRELLLGRGAVEAHVAKEHPGSVATTDFATSTAPSDRGSESVGLKTHISTALGGLLDRAFGSRPERGLCPGGPSRLPRPNRSTPSPPPKETAFHLVPESGSSASRRPRRVYDTEMVSLFWQQLNARTQPTDQELERATAVASGKFVSYPYACFYCECRFEKVTSRNGHMEFVHKNEIISTMLKQGESEVDPHSASGGEDSDRNRATDFGTPQEVAVHCNANYDRPKHASREAPHGRREWHDGLGAGDTETDRAVDTSAYSEEIIKQKAIAALCEMSTRGRWARGRGGRGRSSSQAEWETRVLPAVATGAEGASELIDGTAVGAPSVKTGPIISPKREIEIVFVKEETPEVAVHRNANYDRPEHTPGETPNGRREWHDGLGVGDPETDRAVHESPLDEEITKQKAIAALRELDMQGRRGTGRQGGGLRGGSRSSSRDEWRSRVLPAVATSAEGASELIEGTAVGAPSVKTGPNVSPKREIEVVFVKEETPVKTVPILSPKREIEVVFVKEDTPFPHEWESPGGQESARDPLSIEEEVDALADDPFPICDQQSIKKEVLEDPVAVSGFSGCFKEDPDLDLQADAADSKINTNF